MLEKRPQKRRIARREDISYLEYGKAIIHDCSMQLFLLKGCDEDLLCTFLEQHYCKVFVVCLDTTVISGPFRRENRCMEPSMFVTLY